MAHIELELKRKENGVNGGAKAVLCRHGLFCKHAGHIYMKGYSVLMIRMISDVKERKITYLKLEIAGMSHTGGLLCGAAR